MSESTTTGPRMRGQCLCSAVEFEGDVPERTRRRPWNPAVPRRT